MDSSIDEVFQKFKENYYQNINQYKQYFAKITVIYLLQKLDRQKQIPFCDPNKFYSTKKSIPENKINDKWTFDQLLELLNITSDKEENDIDLINIISFSVIPSIFLFFMEEESFNSFISFINNLSNKPSQFYILFSRALFVSPLFTNFIFHVFYYNITDVYLQTMGEKVIEKIREKILISFVSEFNFFPDYLSIFFRKIENKSIAREIFKHAFCEEMIKNPSIFFATDSWHICFPTKSEEVSNFLRVIINDQMIDDMLKIIEEKNNYCNSFLSREITSVYHQFISNHTVFDNFDLISLDFIENNSENLYEIILEKKNEDYCIFNYVLRNVELENDDQQLNIKSIENAFLTQINKSDLNLTKVFNAFMLQDILLYEEKENKIPIKFVEFIKNINKYQQQNEIYVQSNQEKSLEIMGRQEIYLIFSLHFYKNITFYEFLSRNFQLIKYDEMIYDFISKNFVLIYDKEPIKMCKYLKNFYLNNGSKFNEFVSRFRNALDENSDPISKSIHIINIINDFMICIKHFESDYMVNCIANLIFFSNSSRLISNFVFIFQLVDWYSNVFQSSLCDLPLSFYAAYIHSAVNQCVEILGEFSFNINDLAKINLLKNEQKETKFKLPWSK